MSEPPYSYPLSPQDWANQFAARTGRTPTQADYEQALAAGQVQPVDAAPAQPGYAQPGYDQPGYNQGGYAQDPYAQQSQYAYDQQGAAYAGYPAPQKKSALPPDSGHWWRRGGTAGCCCADSDFCGASRGA
ncbi:MAG: hypothetical protein Q4P78_02395 [Rothia sp. (in: high G+C Gram-positive bacteria)]|uniref:hypothetical protein n=1 Tax=Rothia sp. (in: high G+C Gram-positive bacteria) TaxID=1885016 RepID=UPI0026DFF80C|nr:hypothetical protein [Rothia sp. (in: high G+C Gram-positive bacteria)]MDO5750037.1 hypothetical protein [Rothia sp. (in: high G+C Gram-positive bacteria)]